MKSLLHCKTDHNRSRNIDFQCADPKGLTPDARLWLERIKTDVRITLVSKTAIRIEYPTDIVKSVRRVNVDDTIFRLDFIDPGDRFWMCHCVFPNLPKDTERFMLEHWDKCSYHIENGATIFSFNSN